MNDRFDLAIWLESDELSHTDQHDDSGDSRASDTSGIQVHLNFWKLPKYNAFDIGINFPTFKHGKVNIFVNTKSNFEAGITSLTYKLSIPSPVNLIRIYDLVQPQDLLHPLLVILNVTIFPP